MAIKTEDSPSGPSKASSITETTLEGTKKDDMESATRQQQTTAEPDFARKDEVVAAEKEAPAVEDPEDKDMEYPHGVKLWVILGALCLSVFLVALDQTIISTAIPKITDKFNSIRDIGWYVIPHCGGRSVALASRLRVTASQF